MRKSPGETPRLADSAEPFFQRYSKSRSQKLSGAAGGNDHVVFTSQAKFTRKIKPGLIRKGHARLEDGLASAHQVGVLVAVKADSMPQPVGEGLIVRAESGIGDHFPGSVIHGAGKPAGAGGIQRGILRLANNLENVRYFFGRLAENSRTGHVRLIALDRATSVNQNDVALFQFLRLDGSMRQRRRSSQQHQRATVQSHLRKAAFYQPADLLLRHSFFDGREYRAKNIKRRLAREPHQLQFMRRFASPAGNRHGISRNVFESRSGRAQMVINRERR